MKILVTTLVFICTISHCLNSQTILVKLNPLNCVNCSFLLPKVVDRYPSTEIVLEKVYEKQHKNIEKLLAAKDYKKHLIYSDSIYKSLKNDNLSEVVVFSKSGEILLQQDLKKVSFELINEYISDEIPSSSINLCDENILDFTNINSINNYLIIRNLLTNELSYSYKNSPSKSVEINTEEMTSIIFTENLKDTIGLQLFHIFKEYPNVKSVLTSYFPLNEDEWYGLYALTHITIENDHDTMFRNKLFLIHSLNKELNVYNLETSKGTYLLQFSLHYWKNKLYIRTFKSEYDINNLPNVLGEIDIENLKNKKANINHISNFVLDPDLIKYGINYNLPAFISSHQFIMYPLGSKIYNLDTKTTIDIPNISQYLSENKVFKEEKRFPFLTYDMKYRKSDESICLLYEFNENLYYSIFKPNGEIIMKQKQILSDKYWDSTKLMFLSQDGKYLNYIPINEVCIKSIEL